MGGLCKSDPEVVETTVVQGTSMPEWVDKGGQSLFAQASELAQRPYQTFGGPRVAGFSQDETDAFGRARSAIGNYQPNLDKAGAALGRADGQWDAAALERYSNPFAQNVTDISVRELMRQHGIAQQGRNANAVQAGAFGGARHGVMDAEAMRNTEQTVADTLLRGNAAAYESARQAFEKDRAADMGMADAYAGLGRVESALGQADINNLLGIGGMQRGLDQASLDTAYQDFENQQKWPYEQTNFASGILRGVPYSQKSTQTGGNIVQQPSALGQASGLATAGLGAYALGRTMDWWG